jgi:hypothetical protein
VNHDDDSRIKYIITSRNSDIIDKDRLYLSRFNSITPLQAQSRPISGSRQILLSLKASMQDVYSQEKNEIEPENLYQESSLRAFLISETMVEENNSRKWIRDNGDSRDGITAS